MKSWKYFPVTAGRKTPALEGNWRDHATDSEAQLAAWEAEGHNLGLHLEDAGLAVIDIDGPDGEAAWATLTEGRELPPTYEVRTPHGRHIYFEGTLRPSVEKLGRKLDTRGLGSYVLVPGDETSDGKYEVSADLPVALLPGWIHEALELASPLRSERAAVSTLDLPVNLVRAVRYLETQPPLIMGEGADHRLYEIAAELRDLGVSGDKSIDLITQHIKICPWEQGRTDAWIVRKVENAEAYSQNQAGAWGVGTLSETYGAVLDQLPADEREGADKPDPFKALNEAEQDALQPPTFLMADLIPNDSVGVLLGPPGSYKSFLALDIGLTLAAGVAGWGLAAAEARAVVYVAGEGPRSIARLRRPAWRTVRDIQGEIPFYLVTTMPLAADISNVQVFVASIKAQGIRPRLVIIDTWARFVLGLNENDAKDAGYAISALEYIKRALHCSVLVLHHQAKEGKGLRGSGAIEGGVDFYHEVVPHKETRVVAVYNRRQKDADERIAPWLFEGKQIGSSLVFQPITNEVYRSLTQADDALDARKVGSALLGLKAVGGDAAVTTHVLATKLRLQPADEAPGETEIAVDRIVRQLRAAAKGRLAAYCERRANEIVWMMPNS